MKFPNEDKRTVMGLIAIHVDDLLISGSGNFIEYITFRMKEKFEVDTFEENKATYIGMKIEKIDTPDFKGGNFGFKQL